MSYAKNFLYFQSDQSLNSFISNVKLSDVLTQDIYKCKSEYMSDLVLSWRLPNDNVVKSGLPAKFTSISKLE